MKRIREFAGDKRNRRRLFVTCLLLACLWLVAWLAARWLIVVAPIERADAIVILSGSSTLLERAQKAANLYSQDRSKRVLLTSDNRQGGWSSAEQRNPFFHEIAIRELKQSGVPEGNIELIGPAVDSTWNEAVAVTDFCKAHNLHSILIVTSSYHSRRALWTFRALDSGLQVGVEPAPTGMQTPDPWIWWLSKRGWDLVFVEYVKLIYYHLGAFRF